VEILDWPLLRTYAGQFAEPVDGDEARKFAARLAALKVGRALGEALRHEPDPALLVRVRAAFSAPHSGDGSPARARASGRGTGGRAIAVIGMHRSGTSLVARLLNLIGVPFGRQETMLPPQPDNPTGYWEQRAVMELNDELLAVLGSAWDDPAGLPRGWEAAPELEPFAERARRLVEEHYGDLPEWGFKDPRLSILLPFWLRVVPDLSFVVCVRNPVDVTHSLERREGSMGGTAADLWLHYTAAALRHTSGRPRLVVAYEDFYMRPREAVERLARFAGHELAELDPDVRARIDEFIQADLWHHRSSLADVLCDPATPAEAQTLYRWLHDGDGSPTAPPGLLDGLAEGLADSRRERARLQGQAEPLREEVRDLTARLAASDTELAGVRARLADVEQELELHKAWLDGIQRSASWQITAPLRRAKSLARRGASD
jgi:hypothetical protein